MSLSRYRALSPPLSPCVKHVTRNLRAHGEEYTYCWPVANHECLQPFRGRRQLRLRPTRCPCLQLTVELGSCSTKSRIYNEPEKQVCHSLKPQCGRVLIDQIEQLPCCVFTPALERFAIYDYGGSKRMIGYKEVTRRKLLGHPNYLVHAFA